MNIVDERWTHFLILQRGDSPPAKKIQLGESKHVDNPETFQDVDTSTSLLGSSTLLTEAVHCMYTVSVRISIDIYLLRCFSLHLVKFSKHNMIWRSTLIY